MTTDTELSRKLSNAKIYFGSGFIHIDFSKITIWIDHICSLFEFNFEFLLTNFRDQSWFYLHAFCQFSRLEIFNGLAKCSDFDHCQAVYVAVDWRLKKVKHTHEIDLAVSTWWKLLLADTAHSWRFIGRRQRFYWALLRHCHGQYHPAFKNVNISRSIAF